MSGFFGWRHGQAQKTPYYVTVRDRPIVALAGVFDCWIDRESDEVVMTYSVITTEANPMMRHINNRDCRMPVILQDGDEVIFRGRCERAGFAPIGFGICTGTLQAAASNGDTP